MSSQFKYILEASLIIFLGFITVRGISFFSSVKLYSYPNSTLIDKQINKNSGSVSSKGGSLFVQHCARCHAINKQLVGPALAGIENRVPDRKLLIAWIRNSPEILQSGDPYFTALFKEYNKIPMDAFTQLKEEEVESILKYIAGE